MQEDFDDLLHALELCVDAVKAKDSDKGFESITIFLMQYMKLFGHSPTIMAKSFPVLENLKDHIKSKRFDEAEPLILALLAKIRMACEQMKRDQP